MTRLFRDLRFRDVVGLARGLLPLRGVTKASGCWIAPGVRFEGGKVSLGRGVTLFRQSVLCGPVAIGDRTFINEGVYVRPGTTIEADCAIGAYVRLLSDTHEIGDSSGRAARSIVVPIDVGRGSWIGAGAIVLGGVSVGAGCVIGAGSVLTKSTPPNTLWIGNPAVQLRVLDQ